MGAGDFSTALRVLDSEAKLEGLFPSEKKELTGKGGAPIVLHVTEQIIGPPVRAALDHIREEVVTANGSSGDTSGQDHPPPPGAGRLPPQ
jgi:hypothetical protein